jgi:hypothetical protein
MARAFKAPPVNTTRWTNEDWAIYECYHGVETEPATIPSSFGTWYKTDKKDSKGDALYSLTKPENSKE